MKRAGDLERLATIRSLRLDRAVRALGEQSAALAAADAQLAAATADAVANAGLRRAREDQLFERLSMRPLTGREIDRAHDALGNLEQRAAELDEAEQAAARSRMSERIRRDELQTERLRLERERDKLTLLARDAAKQAARRAEQIAEFDADGEATRRPIALARRAEP